MQKTFGKVSSFFKTDFSLLIYSCSFFCFFCAQLGPNFLTKVEIFFILPGRRLFFKNLFLPSSWLYEDTPKEFATVSGLTESDMFSILLSSSCISCCYCFSNSLTMASNSSTFQTMIYPVRVRISSPQIGTTSRDFNISSPIM